MQHPDKLPQLPHLNFLGSKSLVKALPNLFRTGLSVEHLHEGELFRFKPEELQPHRVLNQPIISTLIALPLEFEVRAKFQPERATPGRREWTGCLEISPTL